MSADLKPIHPEVMYAERSSATEPEKVRFGIHVMGSKADHIFSSFSNVDIYLLSVQNVIYFTINTPDIVGEPEIDIKAQEISFSAKAGE